MVLAARGSLGLKPAGVLSALTVLIVLPLKQVKKRMANSAPSEKLFFGY
jgi:hypothetical protein